MSDTPLDERRFSDREVREILEKAVKRTPADSRALTTGEGLSLTDLKAIGKEVGISPNRLEEAARSVSEVGANPSNKMLGGPTVVRFGRKIDSEFDPEETPELLSLIRRSMGNKGEVEEIRGSVEWRSNTELVTRYVTVSQKNGETTVEGSSNLSGAAIVTFVPGSIVGLMMTAIAATQAAEAESMPAMLALMLVLPVLFVILRTIYSKVSETETGKLQAAVDDVARWVEDEPD